jgi:ATP-dependent DNA helicase PIF1
MNEQQTKVLDAVKQRRNVFLTGPAGCGKSYVIAEICKWAQGMRMMYGVTATTGSASFLIHGQTLHSFLGVGLAESSADILALMVESKKKWLYKKLQHLQLLIVDEISMASDVFLDKISRFLTLVRMNELPFGGVQVVLSGDFMQLPPVSGDFCFLAKEWRRARLDIHVLTQNMRQMNDLDFQDILSRARWGTLTLEDISKLAALKDTEFPSHILPTRLYAKRVDVDVLNDQEFKKLLAQGNAAKTYKAQYSNEQQAKAWASSQGIPETIELCVGAQVVITWNICIEDGIVNGTRGVVSALSDACIEITTVRGKKVHISRLQKSCENSTMWVSYFPIRLAYALTIHKSQGMTLDAVELDVGDSIFEYGQAYTALSRVKDLKSLRVKHVTQKAFRTHDNVKEFYQKF